MVLDFFDLLATTIVLLPYDGEPLLGETLVLFDTLEPCPACLPPLLDTVPVLLVLASFFVIFLS